ncbi:MAG: ABC transporter substrate-binding protein [Bacilli bacterium]|nr:ABC transporter substrate-binding protein [Bacilli bacterium]
MKAKKTTYAMLLALAGSVVLAGCGTKSKASYNYTHKTYTTVSPSNWNELTYQDENDTQFMGYIGGQFFEYDFKFDSEGKIVDGEFEIEYSAVSKIEDVTTEYAGDPSYDVPEDATSAYAFKLTLRDDLKWDDGTEIHASDFVYSMKEQLNPLFQNYRADSFYNGSTVIHNAKNYVYQGQFSYAGCMISASYKDSEYVAWEDFGEVDVKGQKKWGYTDEKGDTHDIKLDLNSGGNWGPDPLADYAAYGHLADGYVDADGNFTLDPEVAVGYHNIDAFNKLAAAADADGKVQMNEELALCLMEVIAYIKGGLSFEEYVEQEGDYAYMEWEEMVYIGADFPELDFNEVGMWASGKNELTIVLDNSLELLDDSGNLTYLCAYNFASLPLVKEDLYEACKVSPEKNNSTLWTTTYNSDVASTASWGPYKLSEFQAGKSYTLVKNPNWYGWNIEENKNLFQTDRIVCETISEWNTAWLKFQAGELDSIGIDVSVANDYKNSERAVYTPSDYVGSLQLQSSKDGLKARESEGINKTILTYTDFRKAISLGINRAEFAKACTTASLPGLGIFNSMHYYDVAHGGVYRNSDEAKKTLCAAYGVDYTKYESLDAAVAAITGYDPTQAKELLNKAYDAALAAGDIKATDKVVLTYGTSTDNEVTRRHYDWLNDALKELAKGTKLEGRLEMDFDASFGNKWATDFQNGAYDICEGGWSGAAWDPGYFLMAYLSADYMYSKAWETEKEMVKFTVEGEEYEMTIMNWWRCLNGAATQSDKVRKDWSEGMTAESTRLAIIAMLEEVVLTHYYTVPLLNDFSASLLSYRVNYATLNYNTFMGYGGIKYMTYNYTDAEWEAYCKNNELDYKI